jgi:hypothetical protein
MRGRTAVAVLMNTTHCIHKLKYHTELLSLLICVMKRHVSKHVILKR